MMRISTNTLYQSGITKITGLQADQAKLQNQISTGKKFTTPSGDPVAAARVLDVSHNKEVQSAYANVRTSAQNKLEGLEGSLSSISDLMIAVQSSLVAAGNGTYSNQERANIGAELQNSLDALIGLANSKDASGNYLYAGYQSQSPAFVASTGGATYQGDSNVQSLQVDAQRQMAVSATGEEVFLANGNDVFATLNNIVNLLNTPITNATTQANFDSGLATAIDNMQTALDNVLNVRSSVGAKLKEIDSLNVAGQSRSFQYDVELSNLQDLDYATAISDFSKNQTIIEAAQQTFSATTQLSLFKFI